jgi:hypothetical protein
MEGEMDWTCGMIGALKNAYRVVIENLHGKMSVSL